VLDDLCEQFGLIATMRSLTAIGKGCGQGGCEARIVLVDGVRTVSCLSLTVQDDGREITTTGMGLGLARPGATPVGSP
jgi:aerobic-type carbon monoxide dehydrogenase small subunit (CoxS/CutS family)